MEACEGSLNERVLAFQRSGSGLSEIVRRLAPRIYAFPRRGGSWEEDDDGEFFLFFYPRLLRALKGFRDQGKPFEWYLNSVLRWHLKSFRQNRRRIRKSWELAGRPEFWDAPGEESSREETFSELPDHWAVELLGLDHSGRLGRESDRRRLLFLALKSARDLEGRALDRVSELTGRERLELEAVVGELRRRLLPKELRLQALRTRRNRAYSRARFLEEELREETEAERKSRLGARLSRARRSLLLAQEEISRVPLSPSNRDIGQVLGVPKGTVDTSLYWLKKRLSLLYAERGRQYA